MNRLSGKIAFITGAGGGIGRAAAILFAREGCSVVIAERDMDAANELAMQIQYDGGSALAPWVDVSDAEYLLGILKPNDVAYMALYLASDESRAMTGQVIAVDSGVSIS